MGRYDPEAANGVTLSSALKEVGLALQTSRGTADYLVVDAASQTPTEN